MLLRCIWTIGSNWIFRNQLEDGSSAYAHSDSMEQLCVGTRVLPVSVADPVCDCACSLANPLMRNVSSSMTLN